MIQLTYGESQDLHGDEFLAYFGESSTDAIVVDGCDVFGRISCDVC